MTIEHSTISFGEIHPVANWAVTVGGVAALGGIPAGDGDIGKVAWVAGVGHYVLASTSPTVWESLGVTITDMTYDIPSATLSIELSDGTTHSVVIVAGLSESEVNTLITDELDDYDVGIKTYIGESITSALGALTTEDIPDSPDRRYVSDAQLTVLAATSGTNSGDETQASIKTKLGAASAEQDGYLSSTDWSTFNSKQAALADVITANTYGSSTQWPVITVNAKGIVTGVTLQTVPTPTFTDANFSVQKAGSPSIAASWSLTALTASRVHTYPDKAINFGDLSFIATTNNNNLSGTGCHVIGGSGNTVYGTDNIAIGCVDNVIEGDGVVALSKYYTGGTGAVRQPRGTTILGTSLHPKAILFSQQSHYGGACATTLGLCTVALAANGSTNSVTTDGETPANSNTPYLVEGHTNAGGTRYASLGGAVHDIDFIISFGVDTPLAPSRTFFARRRVYAAIQIVGVTPEWYTSTEVVGTDANLGTVVGTVTIGFTLDTANNRLVPTVSATGGQLYQVSARVNSHYNRK